MAEASNSTKTKTQYTKYPLTYLTWIDAESDTDWTGEHKTELWIEEDFVVNEVGWIIAETDKYIVICSQICEEGSFGNKTKVPKAWIRSQVPVEIKHGKKRRRTK